MAARTGRACGNLNNARGGLACPHADVPARLPPDPVTAGRLADRLREYPPSSVVLVAFPAERGEETRLRRMFAHLRTHGHEWFPYAPQVTEWVDRMVAEHGAPDPTWVCGPARHQVPRPHADRPTLRVKGHIPGTGVVAGGKTA